MCQKIGSSTKTAFEMASYMQELMDTVDSRTVFVAIGSIALSLILGLPKLVPILKWLIASLRLKFLLLKEAPSSDVSVSGIFVHPVKSMRSISLQQSTLDRKGLTDDRRFMVVFELALPSYKEKWEDGDTTHRFLTQRQCPSLATITATIDASGKEKILVLEQKIPKHATKKVCIPLKNQSTSGMRYLAGIWDDVVAVEDMGEEAAAFLQEIADADEELTASLNGSSAKKIVRLVKESSKPHVLKSTIDHRSYVPGYAKTWKGDFLGKPTLTDGFPVLIASEASLEALNQKLVKGGKEKIPMSRFRPNIVVKGDSLEPFEEDRWKVIAIGNVVFAIVKACPRCKQSCTDQVTGVVSPQMEPVTTMASFRRAMGDQPSNGDVFFAQNAIPIGKLDGETIQLGDSVKILERGDPVYR